MGGYAFTAYDVKGSEIKKIDYYESEDGVYEYKGNNKYNLSKITTKLTSKNVEKYIK